MFGIGPSELVIVGVLFLIIFGPSKLPQMARDAGRLMTEARRAMDDFKEELTSASDDEKENEKKPAKKTSEQRSEKRAKARAGKSDEEAPAENGRVKKDKEEKVDEDEEYDL